MAFEKKVIEVYSKKHDIHGQILDYHVVIKLRFEFNGRKIEMGLQRPFPNPGEEEYQKLGEEIINTYVEKILNGEITIPKTMLHYWYVEKVCDSTMPEGYLQAHGVVSGHDRLMDTTFIHTSMIKEIKINEETGEAEIHTMNTVYYCPLSYCLFNKQDKFPGLIPNYDEIKEKYKDSKTEPKMEEGNVLLVLSNFNEYYFHSLYYLPRGESQRLNCIAHPHIGTFQDSFLIEDEEWENRIDIRYFPHYGNIEFYSQHTDGCPLFVENIGSITLFVKASCGTLKLEPGERKEVIPENTEEEGPVLPQGDLYPAGIME